MVDGKHISIRAPLAGSDNRRRCRRLRPAYFNSRSPCGERRTIFGSRASALAFQSALPLRGATRLPGPGGRRKAYFNPRSPCGERHPKLIRYLHIPAYFNPRSPCGERRRASRGAWRSPDFNPRSPCGERPPDDDSDVCRVVFQSALPLRGATIRASHADPFYIFQSALPLRGATRRRAFACLCLRISIRAPLAGSDRYIL